jgi:hypothetical protein
MPRRTQTTAWPADPGAAREIVPRRRDGVHGVEIDSESVLYDEHNGRLHLLNWSASAVWWSIDGIATADQLAADLAEVFAASHDAMRADVLALLAMLGERLLVEPVTTRSRRLADV